MWNLDTSFVIDPQDWYDKDELLEAARKEGFIVTKHVLKDWVEQGLLAQEKECGRKVVKLGRRHGSTSMWSRGQRSLFLELLRGRQQKPHYPIGTLCVFPVWRWIYLGEQHGGVGLSQVRRAMKTWANFRRTSSVDHTRAQAHKVLKILQGDGALQKRDAVNELVNLYTFQKEVDVESLEYQLSLVMTQPHLLHFEGYGEMTVEAKHYADMLKLVHLSYQQYEQIADLDDTMWEWARIKVLSGHAFGQSSNLYSILTGNESARFTVYDSLESSTGDLIGYLSEAVWNKERHEAKDDPLDLRIWRAKEVTYQVVPAVVYTSLLLPDGSNVPHLFRNVVHLRIIDQDKECNFTLDLPYR